MERALQHRFTRLKAATFAFALSALAAGEAQAADPFASDWSSSAKSRARLIADGAGGAGLEIELSPGAITYWRDPGEAGVPPSFDFAGSENLASAEVLFPAPMRMSEPDGSTANGYRDDAIFPIRVLAAQSGKPVALKLNAQYAVCEKICLPARASLTLLLPTGISGTHGEALAKARAEVPEHVDFASLGGEIAVLGESKWKLCFKAAPGEIFLEPPRGAWLDAKPTTADAGHCRELALKEPPLDPKAPLTVIATLVGPETSRETSFELPRSGP